ncbi:replication fork protection component Swi3-domain-containing protein [Endogone sp. FLAS-F59071]|nr:replication fork protection component Swi3-domain-containing protein [Endogone sp. FLAS-F59071]|eukprot:RUS19311.1 replication fork protection component Swi3-domain-containing protein [Endogone sp. FLAS-F59071]
MDYGDNIVLDSYNVEETFPNDDDDIPALPAPIDTDARMNEYRAAANNAVAKSGGVNKVTERAVSRAGKNGEDLDKVKKRKKRNPVKKVDAELLLSKDGLSRLRHEGTKLRFQGKGNEAKDLRKFMNFYQMWAHELYPRLQFRDFVRMAENTCHQRRCRVHLTQWQNETTGIADTTIAEHGLSGMTLEDNGTMLEATATDRNETTQPPTEPSPRPLPPSLLHDSSSRSRQDQVVHPTSSQSLNSVTGNKTDEPTRLLQLERIRANRAIALARLAERQQQQEKAKTSQCGVPTNDAPSLPSSSLQVVGPFEFGEEPVGEVDPAEEYLSDFDF